MRESTQVEPLPGELNLLSESVIGAAIEVHRVLGPGFLESVYEEALAAELKLRSIPFARQAAVAIVYKEQTIADFRVDLLVGDGVIVELKAVESLLPIHEAQLMSYMKAAHVRLGLLINFNVRKLVNGIERIAV
jgi:GxxExxY protein